MKRSGGGILARCRTEAVTLKRAKPMMGTIVGVTVRGPDARRLAEVVHEIFREVERLVGVLSERIPSSAVSLVNRMAGVAPVKIPSELTEVTRIALQVSHATAGAFDPTWATLGPLWNMEDTAFCPPDVNARVAALENVGYRDVLLDEGNGTLFLRRPGMRLGLGGVAKAYIAERAADFAVASGIGDILIDAGGDLVARGEGDGRRWTVGVRSPSQARGLLATVQLRDEAIATSGDYERFVEVDGRRYHHILDPRTGEPACRSQSVTVIARNAAFADAFGTGLFVLGPEGLGCTSEIEGVAALVVDENGISHSLASTSERFGVRRSL